jgi:uncharacterized protein (DUF305 family)
MTGDRHSEHGASTGRNAFARDMAAAMTGMMRDMHAAGYSGNADVDFLAMMIPHHRGAIEMARLVLLHGRDPATRRMAEEIVAAQTSDIAAMQGRLDLLRRKIPGFEREYPELGGTRGPPR